MNDEPGAARMFAAAMKVVRRGAARPLPTLVMAAGAAALAVIAVPRVADTRATAVVRIAETSLNAGGGTLRRGDLAAWVSDAALAGPTLLAIAERYGIYAEARAQGSEAVIDAFREDLEVNVSSNYFLVYRGSGDPLRSARIAISWDGGDAARAGEVARALARAVIDYERRGRAEAAKRAIDVQERLRALARELRLVSVDEPEPVAGRERLWLLGCCAFAFSLPLAAVGAGAFDARVRAPDDLRGLGVQILATSVEPRGGKGEKS